MKLPTGLQFGRGPARLDKKNKFAYMSEKKRGGSGGEESH